MLMCPMEVDKESLLGLAGAGLLSQQAHFPHGDTMCLRPCPRPPGRGARSEYARLALSLCCAAVASSVFAGNRTGSLGHTKPL